MSYGKVVLDYGDSLVRESDVTILKTNQWLNDAIIGFYFEYLGNQTNSNCKSNGDSSPRLEFYGPGVTQLLKLIPNSDEIPYILGDNLDNLQYGFWPVNDSSDTEATSSGSHWSLLVFSRPDNKFLHFDSYGGTNESAARILYRKLSPVIASTSMYKDYDGCCAQANGRDCGLHVVVNAQMIQEFVCKRASPSSDDGSSPRTLPQLWRSRLTTATPKQADSMRSQLVQLIESLSVTATQGKSQ